MNWFDFDSVVLWNGDDLENMKILYVASSNIYHQIENQIWIEYFTFGASLSTQINSNIQQQKRKLREKNWKIETFFLYAEGHWYFCRRALRTAELR